MYGQGKYVSGEIITETGVVDGAIVIPETVPHSAIRHCFIPGTITGAGFFTYNEAGVNTYGESNALGISSCDVDEIWVGRAISHPKYHR